MWRGRPAWTWFLVVGGVIVWGVLWTWSNAVAFVFLFAWIGFWAVYGRRRRT
jgi:hypothetical protein